MIQLDVSKIKNHPGQALQLNQSFEMASIEDQNVQVHFPVPLKLEGTIINEAGYLRLNGYLHGKAQIACGRCLEPFELPLKIELDETFYSQHHNQEDVAEDWTPYHGEQLDMTPVAVKAIISELPMKVLCAEDCKGICQKCGKNRNQEYCDCINEEIDPRLEILKKFLDQKK